MTALSAYGPNPWAGASSNSAQAHGWGPGWPNAQTEKMITVSAAGVKVRVRREVAALVQTLMLITAARGYKFKVGACWGFANRAIRGTQTPSNHSWGLALDWNSEDNPQQRPLKTDLPPAVVRDWEACGFYWGGRYARAKPDPMHFEYIRRPGDVAADLKKARAILAGLTKKTAPGGGTAKPPAAQPATVNPVSLAALRYHATHGTGDYNPPSSGPMCEGVKRRLIQLGCGDESNSFRTCYAAWQRKLGYEGTDADGIPGEASLKALAAKSNWTLVK